MLRRIYDVLNALLLVLVTYEILSSYSGLPSLLPMQFNNSGVARWGSKSELVTMLVLMLLVNCVFYALILFGSRDFRLLNVPGKKEVLKIDPEKQKPYWRFFREFMTGTAFSANLLMFLIVQFILGRAKGMDPWASPEIGVVVILVLAVIYIVRMFLLSKKLVRENPISMSNRTDG